MSETLRHKMRSAVFAAFDFGIDKRQHKASLDTTEKIYSITSRNQYLDRINDFCKTCPDVKSVLQLTPEAVKRYLDVKAVVGNCTQKTLDDYRHEMKKIGKCMGLDLSCPQVWAWSDPAKDRGAKDVIPREDYYKIASYAMETRSARGWAQNNGFTRREFYIILFLKYEPISGREGRRMLWNATTRAIRLMWRS